jgi:two-component system cell cycle response regulator
MRAIVIDPSRSYRKLVMNALKGRGVDVLEAGTIADARALFGEAKPDVICMAMTLADGDSAKFCLQIRTMPELRSVPIVMLTSNENLEATHRCLTAGVTALFRRQEFDAFARYVERLLDRRSRQGRADGLILYLEDTRSVALKTRYELISRGFAVDTYSRAEDGIAAFNAKDYDLVLTDVVLEGAMTGMALVETVRAHEDPTRRTVPVIAVSSYNDPARRLQLFRAGVDDYVSKPVLEEELIARVRRLIENRRLLRQLAHSHARMNRMAMTDQLTGLHNRHYLNEKAQEMIQSALRDNRPLSVVVSDVDRFKAINDTHGHEKGDEVMAAIGELLAAEVRAGDIAVRMGGEEFLLLLSDCPLEDALARAEQLRARLEQARPAGLHVTASFGVSSLTLGDDINSLLKRADDASYAAKGAGRNCVLRG